MRPTDVAAVLALCMAGLLSGCAGAQPGVAAQVGDESIMVSEVNQLADGFCLANERQLKDESTVVPMQVVSGIVLQTLLMKAAAEQLAEENDVRESPAYAESVATIEQQSSVLEADAAEAQVAVESGIAYVTDVLESIGRQSLISDGVAEPSSEDASSRGRDLLSVWVAKNQPEVDPQYGLELVELQPEFVGTTTSFAVSDMSRVGERAYLFGSPELGQEEQQQVTDYARALPESQRCG